MPQIKARQGRSFSLAAGSRALYDLGAGREGTDLADVFISYSRLDHDRVKPIADRLTSLGYSIWWDKHLRAGQVFVDEIEKQLDSARAVLAACSSNARNSTWVYAEAARGLDQKKFVQVKLDGAALPLPFDALQAADMRGGGEWGPLEHTLTQLVRNRVSPEPERRIPSPGFLGTPAAAGMPKLLTTATGATLIAYAGAVGATYNGVMTPDQLQLALYGMLGVAGVSTALTAQRLLSVTRAGG